MKGITCTAEPVYIPRKRIRKNSNNNWKHYGDRRSNLVTSTYIVIFWILALAKTKIRYILGAYTVLLTVSNHCSLHDREKDSLLSYPSTIVYSHSFDLICQSLTHTLILICMMMITTFVAFLTFWNTKCQSYRFRLPPK